MLRSMKRIEDDNRDGCTAQNVGRIGFDVCKQDNECGGDGDDVSRDTCQ